MKKIIRSITPKVMTNCLLAILLVAGTTVLLVLTGRDTLGEAVIALLYLLPVVWSAYRWGQLPGIIAALAAALAFDFFFIPPFHTFTVGRLEGWLVLAIFLAVAIVVVGRINASVLIAREAVFKSELCSILADSRTPEAVAYTTANYIRQLFQASLVQVIYYDGDGSTKNAASKIEGANTEQRPDRVSAIMNSWGMAGEIQIWSGQNSMLPSADSPLMQNFTSQVGRAFERTRQLAHA
jgi:K+-sensing histidine kinase KdpD